MMFDYISQTAMEAKELSNTLISPYLHWLIILTTICIEKTKRSLEGSIFNNIIYLQRCRY